MEVSMGKLLCVLSCGLVAGIVGLGTCAHAELQEKKEASNKEKVVGVWEVTKSASGIPVGSVYEFTNDGKLKIKIKPEGKDEGNVEGTYSVDGDTITSAGPKGENSDKNKIKKLTDSELITVD